MDCKEKILSNDYVDIIADFRIPGEFNYQLPIDYCYHEILGEIGVLYARRSDLPINGTSAQSYSFLPKCYGLMGEISASIDGGVSSNVLALIDTGILAVQSEPLNLTGRRVTIGFIDTGVRYQNEVFLNQFGETRILAIWDQTIQTGTPPEGFEFGTEYTREMINEALSSANPLSIVPSTDTQGHGTAIASVAAGSKVDGNDSLVSVISGRFTGAAPDSDIVVVKLKEAKQYLRDYYRIPEGVPCYMENDIMLAIQYMQKYVQNLYRPLVICIGVGTSIGDHAGNSSLENYMMRIMDYRSRVFVVAGGNEGNEAHHYRGEVNRQKPSDNVELKVGRGERGFVMDFWGGVPFLYTITIRTPGGESVEWINPRLRIPQEYTFVFDRTKLIIEYYLVEQSSGEELIRFRFTDPTEGVWNIRVNTEREVTNGVFDIWLPISQFISSETYFLSPNPDTTLTSPSYARGAISVTAYNDENGSLYAPSGRGFSSDGYYQPDIAAPGVNVSTALGANTGTSIAAALTAGAAAQILQWAVVEQNDVFVSSEGIRNYLIRGAKRDNSLTYPNREWGYGKLDVEGVFDFLAGI